MTTERESLGAATLMDRALAARHGVPYVHLAVFAIDVDRVREAIEQHPDIEAPFGWEVFLTERYLLERFDPTDEGDRTLIEDLVLGVLDHPPGSDVLGSQVAFAVWHAVGRGAWPKGLRVLFRTWKHRPTRLGKALDALFADEDGQGPALAAACLAYDVEPPLAAPTVEALGAMAGIA